VVPFREKASAYTHRPEERVYPTPNPTNFHTHRPRRFPHPPRPLSSLYALFCERASLGANRVDHNVSTMC